MKNLKSKVLKVLSSGLFLVAVQAVSVYFTKTYLSRTRT